MRVLQVHNSHLVRGGAERMFAATVSLLKAAGHQVTVLERYNGEITGWRGRVGAAVSGAYSLAARRDLARLIARAQPDVVHVHHVYPLLSPSVLDACAAGRVPVVMRLADFTPLCPTSHHFRRGSVCELCLGGREYRCLLTNCRGDIFMSAAYAARTAIARVRRCFPEKVARFIAPTGFVRDRFLSAGYPADKIAVIPNMVEIPASPARPGRGSFIVYVGRVSPEKGVEVLLEAAARSGLPVRVAGDASAMPQLERGAPPNVSFLGELSRPELSALFAEARFAVVPSTCFETFNLACAEAMAHGLPVIASRIGGLPEVVGEAGRALLFEPGDAEALAGLMGRLWRDPEWAARLGAEARRRAVAEFNPVTYYERLMALYESVAGGPR